MSHSPLPLLSRILILLPLLSHVPFSLPLLLYVPPHFISFYMSAPLALLLLRMSHCYLLTVPFPTSTFSPFTNPSPASCPFTCYTLLYFLSFYMSNSHFLSFHMNHALPFPLNQNVPCTLTSSLFGNHTPTSSILTNPAPTSSPSHVPLPLPLF